MKFEVLFISPFSFEVNLCLTLSFPDRYKGGMTDAAAQADTLSKVAEVPLLEAENDELNGRLSEAHRLARLQREKMGQLERQVQSLERAIESNQVPQHYVSAFFMAIILFFDVLPAAVVDAPIPGLEAIIARQTEALRMAIEAIGYER
jgi:hypothetical protein